MKLLERNNAQRLRRRGLSIKQIATELKVSKGSVSAWVRDIEIPEHLLTNIENRLRLGRENSRKSRLLNIAKADAKLNLQCKTEILPLSQRDLWIAGLMLYAGEGYKSARVSGQRVEIANSNPEILRIFMNFLTQICSVPKEKIRVRLMLYEDIDPEKAKRFWSNELGVSSEQFCKPFIKESFKDTPYRHLRRSQYGTAHVNLYDTKVYKKIIGWIKAIYEYNNLSFKEINREVAQFG
ncbi:MAG: hypothetical protein PHO03_06425 [Candidatus Omnitrophica bacterium]|nr:hypothetical protein [Candidatus Omnitrophota bacterium]